MFGIGMPEMLLILVVALIVIGPKKLPDLAKSLGRAMGEFKKATSEIKQSIGMDADFREVKETFSDIKEDIKGTVSFDHIDEFRQEDGKPIDITTEVPSDIKNRKTADTDEALGNLKQAFEHLNDKDADPPANPTSETDFSEARPDAMNEEPDTDDRG